MFFKVTQGCPKHGGGGKATFGKGTSFFQENFRNSEGTHDPGTQQLIDLRADSVKMLSELAWQWQGRGTRGNLWYSPWA